MLPRRSGLALAALAALAAGCNADASPYFGSTKRVSRDTTTFYVNNGSEPEYLDPGKCAEGICSVLITQLFEGLTRRHPEDGRPVQGVAARWEKSDDNRVFRFHLRPDARWSDGARVTAGDFEYAYKRALSPRTASRAAGNLDLILNAEPFRRGVLRAIGDQSTLLAAPREGAEEVGPIERGALVRVLARQNGFAKVERWSRLPTFRAAPDVARPPPLQGFVPERALVEDARAVGVRATSDDTLEIELEHPAPHFLDLTSHHALYPVRRDVIERFEQRGEGDLWTRPKSMISNGPYVLDTWRFQYEITLKANPHYQDHDKLRLKRLVFLEVAEHHATMNLYKAGELDFLGDTVAPPAEYVPLLSSKKDFQHNDFLAVYWYELNTRKPPLDDARVRRALDLAIDKKQLVERVTRGGQTPATHYVPDFTGSGYSEIAKADRARGADPFADRGFDPARARALLVEAGFHVVEEGGARRAEGFPPLEILYNTGEGHRQIAVAVQAMWREHLGVAATLRSEEWKVMLKTYRDGDYQVMRFGQTADYDHPLTFLDPFLAGSPQNRTGWADERFEQTIERASRERDPAASIRLYREAERIAVEATPRLPLYFYTRSTLVKPWVKGFRGSRREPHSLQYLWIDPSFERSPRDELAYTPEDLPPPGRIEP